MYTATHTRARTHAHTPRAHAHTLYTHVCSYLYVHTREHTRTHSRVHTRAHMRTADITAPSWVVSHLLRMCTPRQRPAIITRRINMTHDGRVIQKIHSLPKSAVDNVHRATYTIDMGAGCHPSAMLLLAYTQ